jgi:hypothetical protein
MQSVLRATRVGGWQVIRSSFAFVALVGWVLAACTVNVVPPSPSVPLSPPATRSVDTTASPGLDQSASPGAVEQTAKPEPTDVLAEGVWSQRPPEPLLIGTAVRIRATELNVRQEPSTSAKRLDTFRAGQVIVVGGIPPVDADGYTWYFGTGPFGDGKGSLEPLPHPAESGLDPTYGWFAARKGAVLYVEPAKARCPTVVDLENLGSMTPAERLACFGGRTIEFEGAYGCPGCIPEVFGRYEPGWLASPNEVNLVSMIGTDLGGHGLNLRIPPALDGRPENGAIIRVRGHFDDPNAADCTISLVPWNSTAMVPHVVPGSIARLWCRQMFAVESYEVTGIDPSYRDEDL